MKRWICISTIMLLTFMLTAMPCIVCGCGDKSAEDSGAAVDYTGVEASSEDDAVAGEDAVDDKESNEEVDESSSSSHTPPVGFGYGAVEGGSGGIMLLKDVYFTESGEYERVVIELTTGYGDPPREGVCMYVASMGELPYSDLEGNPVDVEGDFCFEITLDSRTADLNLPDAPDVYEGPEAFGVDMDLIKGATFVTAYAYHTLILLIGLADWVPFRIEEMSNPSRIVIDFAP